jgi:hypothetical protein
MEALATSTTTQGQAVRFGVSSSDFIAANPDRHDPEFNIRFFTGNHFYTRAHPNLGSDPDSEFITSAGSECFQCVWGCCYDGYAAGTTAKVEYTGNEIKYYRDDLLVRTKPVSSGLQVFAELFIYDEGMDVIVVFPNI